MQLGPRARVGGPQLAAGSLRPSPPARAGTRPEKIRIQKWYTGEAPLVQRHLLFSSLPACQSARLGSSLWFFPELS